MRFIGHSIFESTSSNKIDLRFNSLCGQRKAIVTLVHVTSSPHLEKYNSTMIHPWIYEAVPVVSMNGL